MSDGLRVQELRVRYGNAPPVIGSLSFSLPQGELLAVLGPSGCGKTTLLGALAGVLCPESGCLTLGGSPLRPRDVPIGLIPQNYGLLPWKTVRQNCLFGARMRGVRAESHLLPLCRRLGIEPLLDCWPRQLSGGQAQRAALARALLMEPRLLLLDEPFAALDIAAASRARQLCLELWRERRFTAVAVTHRLEEALYLGTRIAVMEPGGDFRLLCENPWQGTEGAWSAGLEETLRQALMDASGGDADGGSGRGRSS